MERYPFEELYRSRPISKVPKSWRYSNCLRDQTPCPTAISAAISTAATATLRHGNGYLANLYTVTQCIQYRKLDWLLSFSWGAMSINSQTGWLLSIITEHAENHAPSALFLHLVLLRAAWNALPAWTVRSVFITLRHFYSKPDLLQMYSNRNWRKTASRLSHFCKKTNKQVRTAACKTIPRLTHAFQLHTAFQDPASLFCYHSERDTQDSGSRAARLIQISIYSERLSRAPAMQEVNP